MSSLLKNIRFYILLISLGISLVIFLWVKFTLPEGQLQITRLAQLYALTSLAYLYLTVIVTPITRHLTFLPKRGEIVKARRAIGVSAFYFSTLHGTIAFFFQLGGFLGLFFLSSKYLLAISLSFTAWVILLIMAFTAFDLMIDKLGFTRWKFIHRFIYLVIVLILIHALMLGSHFSDLSATIPQITYFALVILLILQANRFDNYLQIKFPTLPKYGISMIVVVSLTFTSLLYLFLPSDTPTSLGIHATHIQLAKQNQSGTTNPQLNSVLSNIPGLQGDRTRRFTTSFFHPDNIQPNQPVTLQFEIYDAASGNKMQIFSRVYEKFMHLIIVDNQLKYFNHIHPDQTPNGFSIQTSFPHPGTYHLYTDFQPIGAIEQQMAFTINVTQPGGESQYQPDTNFTKTFDKYQIRLDKSDPLKASDLSIGNQKLTFIINDANTHQPIITLKPYLASFGHLVMINTQTYDYLHVHPTNIVAPQPNQNGGPTVEFLPLGLYAPIKPGTYRIFAQFNPDNNLIVADFTVKVE